MIRKILNLNNNLEIEINWQTVKEETSNQDLNKDYFADLILFDSR